MNFKKYHLILFQLPTFAIKNVFTSKPAPTSHSDTFQFIFIFHPNVNCCMVLLSYRLIVFIVWGTRVSKCFSVEAFDSRQSNESESRRTVVVHSYINNWGRRAYFDVPCYRGSCSGMTSSYFQRASHMPLWLLIWSKWRMINKLPKYKNKNTTDGYWGPLHAHNTTSLGGPVNEMPP